MIRFLFLYFIITWVAFTTKATNVVFTVKDKLNDQAIAYAKVGIGKEVKQTDSLGQFTLSAIKGPVELSISAMGYQPLNKVINSITKNTYTIYLIPSLTEMKQVVVTGQAKPMLASQSIYKVNTVNSQQIAQRGAVTLNDVLNFENNNFISNDNILGSAVSIGGIGGQNVKILVNGIPITGRENGNIDLGQINLQNVKRIEMIQGPMSVIYGSNAMGGVINLITQNPQKPLSISGRTYLESIGKYNFSGNLSYKHKKHQLQTSIARNFFQGWTPQDSLDRFQLWKPKTQYLGDLNYFFEVNKKIKLSYFGSYLYEKISNKGTPIISPHEGYAFDEFYITNRLINSLNASVNLNDSSFFVFQNSYSHYYRRKNRYKKDLVSLEQIPTTSRGDQDSSTFRTINLRGVYTNTKGKYSDISIGYEYNYETGLSTKLSEHIRPISDLGIFASGVLSYHTWSVQPSIRYSLNSQFKKSFTPALHLKWDAGKNTQIRGSWAQGFRTPSLKEMYLQFIDQNHTIIGNEELNPEKGSRYELNVTHQVNIKKIHNQIGVMLAYNRIQNMIALAMVPNHSVLRQYENIENYKNFLVNVSLNTQYRQISMKQGFGFIKVEPSQALIKHHILEYSNVFSVHIQKIRTVFNLNYKFNSKQPVLSTDNTYLFTDPIHIANASLQRSFLNRSLQVQLGIKNLLNIQNTNLTGASDLQGNAHNTSSGMYLFPERSVFVDLNYQF